MFAMQWKGAQVEPLQLMDYNIVSFCVFCSIFEMVVVSVGISPELFVLSKAFSLDYFLGGVGPSPP